MNPATRRLIIILTLPLFVRCSGLPESYGQAEAELEKKNIASAAKLLEQANKQKADTPKIEEKLATINYQYFQLLNKEVIALSALDLNRRVEKLDLAEKQIASAINFNKKKHTKLAADGPSMMESLSLKMNSNYQTEAMKLNTLIKKQVVEREKNQGELKKALAEQSKIDNATIKIEALSQKKQEKAWTDFNPYLPYSAFMPQVAERQKNIQERLVDYYFTTGFSLIQKKKTSAASDQFKKGLSVIEGNALSLGGIESAAAAEMAFKNDYQQAFISIKKAESILPDNASVLQLKKEIAKSLVDSELTKAKKLVAESSIDKNIQAFSHYRFLISVADEVDSTLKERLPKEEAKLRSIIAKKLIAHAEKYEKTDLIANSALILRNYQMANFLDPKLLKSKESKAVLAKSITAKKDQMKVLLYDERNDKNTDMMDAGIVLSEGLVKNLTDLKTQKIAGMTLITRDDLPATMTKKGLTKAHFLNDKKMPFSLAEVIIHNQVEELDFVETGRDQPRQKSSQYISGQRWVHNPQYDVAYQNWANADQNYRYQSQQREQALRSCDQMGNAFAQGICRGAVQGLTSYERDSARATLNNTPREIAENVISSYRYTTYNIKVKGKIVASVSFYDKRQGLALPAQRFDVIVDKEGVINQDVEASDQNGVVGGPIGVPDLIAERDQAKRELTQKITASVNESITRHYYNRYCQIGEALTKKKKFTEAAESFLVCQNLAERVGTPVESAVAKQTIDQVLGINADQAQRYGYQSESMNSQTEPSRAPASVEEDNNKGVWPAGSNELDAKMKGRIDKYLLQK